MARASEVTRRGVLRGGLLAGGAALAAPAIAGVRDASAKAAGDAALIERAIRLENTAVAAYDAALRSGRLDSRVRASMTRFRAHEQEHVRVLSAALRGMGGSPPAGTDAAPLARLRRARDQAGIVSVAIELESATVGAYYDALGRLSERHLLVTVAQIMANEGQHLVILRQAANRRPVPFAFENGKR